MQSQVQVFLECYSVSNKWNILNLSSAQTIASGVNLTIATHITTFAVAEMHLKIYIIIVQTILKWGRYNSTYIVMDISWIKEINYKSH